MTVVAAGAGSLSACADAEKVADALAEQGWIVLPGFLPLDKVRELRAQAQAQWEAGAFHAAGVGRGRELNINETLRGDQVQWLEPATAGALADYQGFIEGLRQNLNRLLYLGLFEFEAHFAVYPPGAFYTRHLDNFRGTSARLVTTVLYLNENWRDSDGGQLRLYTHGADEGEYLDIFPSAGTLALFRSPIFWHEVKPTLRERFSVTGWLRARGGAF